MMKIKLDIECSPQEARAFFGLPDLDPVHQVYIERMQAFVKEGLSASDIEKLMRGWLPFLEGGFDAWSKTMQHMTSGAASFNKD